MSKSTSQSLFLVSACLVGLCTRYDGKTKPDPDCLKFLAGSTWIPVCPEQLGGLPTPRPAADIIDGDGRDVLQGRARVCTKDGEDVTASFTKGARQILELARLQEISGACLKSRSPSCAISGTVGVTAALLADHGYRLYEF
ncbi:MAG: DUF523 domain-containing protein [Proteobacteria bacterium]|nr:DUF523 domain-containing protein [Pseudomonadota bacterium]MBU1137897.1 DUF523 domain-containing protein [Pseudomonadota bacterium]MBU1231299.1 DUF523 domain-containing protein [Pseudomonadota bacterium]MBU1417799.1 DUF523 domain-containing protein [Pseudomonadota bacterium]MBU1453675.1 DUF523 domain-containing protein [Pseudomonadota bacterium]